MKIKNTQNTTQTPEEIEFTQRVEAILGEKNSSQADITLIKKQISLALSGDKHRALFLLSKDIHLYDYLPVALQREPELIKMAITQNPKKFIQLDSASRQNPEIQEIALRETISKRGNVMDIIGILESGNKKNKKISVLAKELISSVPGYFSDAGSKYLYEIYCAEPKLFALFTGKGFIDVSVSGVSLGNTLIKHLAKVQSKLEGQSEQECNNLLVLELLKLLGLKESGLSGLGGQFIEFLISSITITQQPEIEEEENQDPATPPENDLADDSDDEVSYDRGPYNCIPLGNSSTIWDAQGSKVTIDTKVLDTMSDKSLENYMNFSRLCRNLGLEFMIQRQARLSQIATGVDFYAGEGMGEAQTLKFFNSIGKNLGVPESSYKDAEGNGKIGCFRTLGDAKAKFRNIRESQTIGGINYSSVYTGDKSIVEVYLKELDLIVEPFGDISLAKWGKPQPLGQSDENIKLAA